MEQTPDSFHLQPWGTAIGLLAGCLIILIGIIRGVSPAEIVLRAATAALLTAGTVRSFLWLLQVSDSEVHEDI